MTPFILETPRLIIRTCRPDDLHAIHRILDLTFGDGSKIADETALTEQHSWLEWSRPSAEWLPKTFQPPSSTHAGLQLGLYQAARRSTDHCRARNRRQRRSQRRL